MINPYTMLGRLQQDCDYYLGAGARNPKHLWALNEADHIAEMRKLWDGLVEKPEWLTSEQLDHYETELLKKG